MGKWCVEENVLYANNGHHRTEQIKQVMYIVYQEDYY
jgi:hypothetical protein